MLDNNYYSDVDGKNNDYFPERSTKMPKMVARRRFKLLSAGPKPSNAACLTTQT